MNNTKPKKYVVVRGGIRVSDNEHDTQSDAKSEFDHWNAIVKRWPDGSIVEVVEKDEKKHFVY